MGVLKVYEAGTWKEVQSPAGPAGAIGPQGAPSLVPQRFIKSANGLGLPAWSANTWLLVPGTGLTFTKQNANTGMDVMLLGSAFGPGTTGAMDFGLRVINVDYRFGTFYFNTASCHFSFGAFFRVPVPSVGSFLSVQGVILRAAMAISSDANDTFSYTMQETAL